MAKRTSLPLLVPNVLHCFALLSSAVKIHDIADNIPSDLRIRAEQLVAPFDSICANIEASEFNDNDEDLIDLIKAKRRETVKAFDFMAYNPSRNANRRAAFNLLLSLPKASKYCGYKSYQILAMNHLALRVDESPPGREKLLSFFRNCTEQHAKSCRNKYELDFLDLLDQANVNEHESYVTIRNSFKIFNMDDRIFDMTGQKSKISADLWDKLIHYLVRTSRKKNLTARMVRSHLNELIDEKLINPCKTYIGFLGVVFAPAIYDSAYEDSLQERILLPYGEFGDALRYYRACRIFVAKFDKTN